MSNPRNALRSLLHHFGVAGPARVRAFQGTGLSKIAPGSGAPSRRLIAAPFVARSLIALCALAGLFALALLVPSFASASLTRPFLRQLSETPSGAFSNLGGIAVDKEDNLWLADGQSGSNTVDEFSPAYGSPPNEFIKALPLNSETDPASLAIRQDNGDLLLTGEHNSEGFNPRVEVFNGATGELRQQWAKFGESAHVAIDNSVDPLDPSACKLAACTAYVTHIATNPEAPRGDEKPPGIEKFEVSPAGEPHPVPFTATAFYIEGNQIVGVPTGPGACEEGLSRFEGQNPAQSITVDPQGNIYVVDDQCRRSVPAVLEYRPSGEFVRAITGGETPGLHGTGNGGWGGNSEGTSLRLTGIAFDSSTGHLDVSLSASFFANEQNETRGAVDEFDAATGRYLDQVTEGPEGSPLGNPVGVAVDSHSDLYVADRQGNRVDVYAPAQARPNLRLAEPSERTHETAVLNGSVEPEGLTLSSCRFQYVTEAAFKQNVEEHEGKQSEGFASLASGGEAPCVPAASAIEPNHTYQPVHAEVKGLLSGTVYRYRLLASTEEPAGGPEATDSLAFTAPHAPRIEATSADNLSSTFADLHAQINPLGAATTYHFEYDTTPYTEPAAHGVSVPVPNAPAGSGGATGSIPASVIQHLSGLTPDTTYHFRVVAENEIAGTREVTVGPDQTFATLPSPAPGLPDNRAYELLTPPNKGSAEDMFAGHGGLGEFATRDRGFPSESGNGFVLETGAAFGPFPPSGKAVYVFSRGAGGWSYKSLASPPLGLQSISFGFAFSPWDISRIAFVDLVGSGASPAGTRSFGLLGVPGGEPPTGSYAKLYEGQPSHGGLGDPDATVIAGSHDLSRVIFNSRSHGLCPGAESQDEGSRVLCEYSAGALKLVNVGSNRCGAQLGRETNNGGGLTDGSAHNAVSATGSRVFFTAPDPNMSFTASNPSATEGCWNHSTEANTPQLYMQTRGETVPISEPKGGVVDPTGPHPAAYVGASEDGSKVFFLSTAELTKDAVALQLHDLELYEYDTETGRLTRISAVHAVRAISNDGSVVYFTSPAKLTADAPVTGEEFGSNQLNVYRYDTARNLTTYVSTILEVEEPTQTVTDWFSTLIAGGDYSFAPGTNTNWTTTPDGRYLLFPTTRKLTSYDTAGCEYSTLPDVQARFDGHCEELYRYHFEPETASGGSIACVSCNPSGGPPLGHAQLDRSSPVGQPGAGPVRAISNDGAYAFFDTVDALVPQDTNRTLDVYEWEAQGTGGCSLAKGCVHLISSGKDDLPSFFLGASNTGADVFFGTHARLVGADTDTAGDLYDARICTAEDPCVKPPAGETAQCQGDTCQSPPAAPVHVTPGSLTFSGAGNLAPAPTLTGKPKPAKCKKRFVKRHGKCVKAKKKKRAKKRAGHKRRAGR